MIILGKCTIKYMPACTGETVIKRKGYLKPTENPLIAQNPTSIPVKCGSVSVSAQLNQDSKEVCKQRSTKLSIVLKYLTTIHTHATGINHPLIHPHTHRTTSKQRTLYLRPISTDLYLRQQVLLPPPALRCGML